MAIKAESLLLRDRFDVKVMPVSPKVRAGCGICLRMGSLSELEQAILLLRKNDIQDVDYYKVQEGRYERLILS